MTSYRPQGSRKFAFTKRGIEALPPHDPDSPSREAEYADAECTGLHLRVSKNGRRFFQHRYRFFGRKKCLSIGEFPAVSLQDARQRVAEHKSALAKDKDPAECTRGRRRRAVHRGENLRRCEKESLPRTGRGPERYEKRPLA